MKGFASGRKEPQLQAAPDAAQKHKMKLHPAMGVFRKPQSRARKVEGRRPLRRGLKHLPGGAGPPAGAQQEVKKEKARISPPCFPCSLPGAQEEV